MKGLPEPFVQRMSRQLGKELPDFLHAMESEPVRGIRMNRMKPFEGMDAYLQLERIPWEGDGYYLEQESTAGATIFHEAGAFYLQEPAAMLPGAVMDAQPGERILDLCAAPGGKATQMGLQMRGEGILVCNDPVLKRAQILSRNLERIGIPNSVVVNAFPSDLPHSWDEWFDGVLVDAPCSGEGMFRRDPETRAEWTPEHAAGCAKRQGEILDEAARMVRKGGRLVYATCTYNPEENEETVNRFLQKHPEYAPEPFELPGADGRTGMLLCLPHRMKGEGQFVAKLRKKGAGSSPIHKNSFAAVLPEEAALLTEQIPGIPVPNRKFGHTMIRISDCPEIRGIHVLRAGLQIAEMRGKNPIPDHAAAMSILKNEISCAAADAEQAARYISGQEINGDAKGWILLQYRGIVIGWGKGSGGKIKNHYPKGLRKERILTGTGEWNG